jgi:hypothetical protein
MVSRVNRSELSRRCVLTAVCIAGVLAACGSDKASTPRATGASSSVSTAASVPLTSETVAVTDGITTATTAAVVVATTNEPTGSGSGATDPCALITSAEASELVGVEVGQAVATPFATGSACIYQSGGSIVGVQVYSAPGTEAVLAANAPLFAPDAVPIDGIGEAAYISEAEATIGVLQNGVIFTVTLAVNGQPATRDQVLAAADIALGHL